jgi:excisionase family DNA binding protein
MSPARPTPEDATQPGDAAPAPVAPKGSTIFLTTDEAAELLRWTADTVRRKASAGQLPGIRLGRHWRFEREQLHAYVRGEWQPDNSPHRANLSTSGGSEAARIFRELLERKQAEKRKGTSK